MDPMTMLGLAFSIMKEGPAAISFLEQTYGLFTAGKVSAEDLATMWTATAAAVKAADQKWQDAGSAKP